MARTQASSPVVRCERESAARRDKKESLTQLKTSALRRLGPCSNLNSPRAQLMTSETSIDSADTRLKPSDAASSQKRVLLVEDDRSVRRYLEVTLQRAGYDVITAGDGLEAMKLALASPVDIVLTDAVMPNMSGQELARVI